VLVSLFDCLFVYISVHATNKDVPSSVENQSGSRTHGRAAWDANVHTLTGGNRSIYLGCRAHNMQQTRSSGVRRPNAEPEGQTDRRTYGRTTDSCVYPGGVA